MPRRKSKPPATLSHHWYLKEWAQQFGKIQADAQRELGWSKGTASELFNGNQRYTQDYIDEVSRWLQLKPYELLMHPDQAAAIRQMRDDAIRLAAAADAADAVAAAADVHAPKTATKR